MSSLIELEELIKPEGLTETKTIALLSPAVDITNHVWITAYEWHVPVKEMSTDHILKCIACWEGRGNKIIPEGYLGGREKWLDIFNRELINRQ